MPTSLRHVAVAMILGTLAATAAGEGNDQSGPESGVPAGTHPVALDGGPGAAADAVDSPDRARSRPAAEQSHEGASYALGLLLGEEVAHSGVERDVVVEELVRGLQAALAGQPFASPQREEAAEFLRHGRQALAARNEAAARAFLARNATATGVQVLPSGLQYRVLVAGDIHAHSPGPDDRVTVNYRASLLDHSEFDSSYARGRPASFRMFGVIKGVGEALAMMKPGAKWRIFVPPDLAYAEMTPPSIPPGSMLIYELELLGSESATTVASRP